MPIYCTCRNIMNGNTVAHAVVMVVMNGSMKIA